MSTNPNLITLLKKNINYQFGSNKFYLFYFYTACLELCKN